MLSAFNVAEVLQLQKNNTSSTHLYMRRHVISGVLRQLGLDSFIHSFIHFRFMIKKVDKTQPYKIKIESIITYADNKF